VLRGGLIGGRPQRGTSITWTRANSERGLNKGVVSAKEGRPVGKSTLNNPRPYIRAPSSFKPSLFISTWVYLYGHLSPSPFQRASKGSLSVGFDSPAHHRPPTHTQTQTHTHTQTHPNPEEKAPLGKGKNPLRRDREAWPSFQEASVPLTHWYLKITFKWACLFHQTQAGNHENQSLVPSLIQFLQM